jgi:hypothetical protein
VSNKLGLSSTNTSCHISPIIKGPTTFHQCPLFGSCPSAVGITSQGLLLSRNASGDPKSSQNKDGSTENQNGTKQSIGLHRFFDSALSTLRLRVVLGYTRLLFVYHSCGDAAARTKHLCHPFDDDSSLDWILTCTGTVV